MKWYDIMWKNTVELFRSLDIPVRTLECCSGDLACKLFSKNAISIRGGATTVLFNVFAKCLLPSSARTRICKRLACASPRFEQLPTKKN